MNARLRSWPDKLNLPRSLGNDAEKPQNVVYTAPNSGIVDEFATLLRPKVCSWCEKQVEQILRNPMDKALRERFSSLPEQLLTQVVQSDVLVESIATTI